MPIREREAQAAPRPRCEALERIANEGNAKRTTELNHGHVASASSFASVEQVAREQPDAKGVIWERCAHACKAEMEQWVAGQKTTRGAFSVEQLFTRVEDAGTAQPSKRAKVLSTMSDTDIAALVAGPQDVQAACQKAPSSAPWSDESRCKRTRGDTVAPVPRFDLADHTSGDCGPPWNLHTLAPGQVHSARADHVHRSRDVVCG